MFYILVTLNAQNDELINRSLIIKEFNTVIKLLNSTPLIEKMITVQQPTLRNSLVVTPYKLPIPNSYLQGTLKRLRSGLIILNKF